MVLYFEGTVADAHEGTLLAGALTRRCYSIRYQSKTGTVAMNKRYN